MTINSGGGTSNVFAFLGDVVNTTAFTGDGISGILFWGAQVEEHPFATSYMYDCKCTVNTSSIYFRALFHALFK